MTVNGSISRENIFIWTTWLQHSKSRNLSNTVPSSEENEVSSFLIGYMNYIELPW